ncbi:hypothetical protein GCM10025770_12590 [Viridibacterium curvum]|uniref:Uncharacterized protein n=1 Tax=Viridibacterium curvum TaxID=1101404 RepID=A0ABP9QHZ1_9RHOO
MRPIWRRSDIKSNVEYVLLLIESDSGDREFELRAFERKDEAIRGGRCCYRTEKIPFELVLHGNLFGIAEQVRLSDGNRFIFDSNGRWHTWAEYEEFRNSFPDYRHYNRGRNTKFTLSILLALGILTFLYKVFG